MRRKAPNPSIRKTLISRIGGGLHDEPCAGHTHQAFCTNYPSAILRPRAFLHTTPPHAWVGWPARRMGRGRASRERDKLPLLRALESDKSALPLGGLRGTRSSIAFLPHFVRAGPITSDCEEYDWQQCGNIRFCRSSENRWTKFSFNAYWRSSAERNRGHHAPLLTSRASPTFSVQYSLAGNLSRHVMQLILCGIS